MPTTPVSSPAATPAPQAPAGPMPYLTYDQWASSNPGDPADQIRGFRRYANAEMLRRGEWDEESAAALDEGLAEIGMAGGLDGVDVNPTDPDAAALSFRQDEAGQAAREYNALLSPAIRDTYDDKAAYGEKLASARALLDTVATRDIRNEARREAVDRGDLPFAVIEDSDGNGSLHVAPGAEKLGDAALADILAANPRIDPSLVGAFKRAVSVPAGYTAPQYRMNRQQEFMAVLASAADRDPTIKDAIERAAAVADKHDGRIPETVIDKLDFDLGNFGVHSEFANPEDRKEWLRDAVRVSRQPDIADKPEDNAIRLSTGMVRIPLAALFNKGVFDATVASAAVPPEQRKRLTDDRAAYLETMAPETFRVIAANKPGFLRHRETEKAKGKTDGQILGEWMSDPANYSWFKTRAAGLGRSVVDAATDLVAAPFALGGNETAASVLRANQVARANRRAYSALFGKSMGLGYDALEMVAPVAADLALTYATGGVGASAVVGKAGLRASVRGFIGNALTSRTRTFFRDLFERKAATALTREMAETIGITGEKKIAKYAASPAVRETIRSMDAEMAIELAGQELARYAGAKGSAAAITATSFTRSAGSQYAGLTAALEQSGKTPEEARRLALPHALGIGAFTAATTLGFNRAFGAGGAEKLFAGELTSRQANAVLAKVRKYVTKLAPAAGETIDTTTIGKALASIARPTLRQTVLKGASEETVEEAVQSLAETMDSDLVTTGKININNAVRDAFYGGVLGGILGGSATLATTGMEGFGKRGDAAKELAAQRSALLAVSTQLAQANAPETAAAVRRYAESLGQQEQQHPEPAQGPGVETPPAGTQDGADGAVRTDEAVVPPDGGTVEPPIPSEQISPPPSAEPDTAVVTESGGGSRDLGPAPDVEAKPQSERERIESQIAWLETQPERDGRNARMVARLRERLATASSEPEAPVGELSGLPSPLASPEEVAAIEPVTPTPDATTTHDQVQETGGSTPFQGEPPQKGPEGETPAGTPLGEGEGGQVAKLRAEVKALEDKITDTESYEVYAEARDRLRSAEFAEKYKARRMSLDERDALLKPITDLNTSVPERGRWTKGRKIRSNANVGGIYETSGETGGVLYRGVTEEDWFRIQQQGFIDTDGRGAISPEDEQINLAKEASTGVEYIPSGNTGVVLAIDPTGLDLFMIGADDYIRASGRIPIEKVVGVSPVFRKGEHNELLAPLSPESETTLDITPLLSTPEEAAVANASAPQGELAMRDEPFVADVVRENLRARGIDPEGLSDSALARVAAAGLAEPPAEGEATPYTTVDAELDAANFNPSDIAVTLKRVAAKGKTTVARSAAKTLLGFGPMLATVRVVKVHAPGAAFIGIFLPNNQIVINTAIRGPRGAVDTLLHELFHAATEYSIASPTKEQKAPLARLDKLRKSVLKRAKETGDEGLLYGASSLSEFVTHFWTSPEFQTAVDGVTPKGQKSWVQVFIDTVREILGLPPTDTALADMVLFTDMAAKRWGVGGEPRMQYVANAAFNAEIDNHTTGDWPNDIGKRLLKLRTVAERYIAAREGLILQNGWRVVFGWTKPEVTGDAGPTRTSFSEGGEIVIEIAEAESDAAALGKERDAVARVLATIDEELIHAAHLQGYKAYLSGSKDYQTDFATFVYNAALGEIRRKGPDRKAVEMVLRAGYSAYFPEGAESATAMTLDSFAKIPPDDLYTLSAEIVRMAAQQRATGVISEQTAGPIDPWIEAISNISASALRHGYDQLGTYSVFRSDVAVIEKVLSLGSIRFQPGTRTNEPTTTAAMGGIPAQTGQRKAPYAGVPAGIPSDAQARAGIAPEGGGVLPVRAGGMVSSGRAVVVFRPETRTGEPLAVEKPSRSDLGGDTGAAGNLGRDLFAGSVAIQGPGMAGALAATKAGRTVGVRFQPRPYGPNRADQLLAQTPAHRNVSRFLELTAPLGETPTQAEIDAWKAANPEGYEELERIAADVRTNSKAYNESIAPRISVFVKAEPGSFAEAFGSIPESMEPSAGFADRSAAYGTRPPAFYEGGGSEDGVAQPLQSLLDAAPEQHRALVTRVATGADTRGDAASLMADHEKRDGAVKAMRDTFAAIAAEPRTLENAVVLDRLGRHIAAAEAGYPVVGEDEVRMQPGVTPAFRSTLAEVIAAKVPNRATPQQILATIDPARGSGVKAEEIKWSGIEAWMSGKDKVDKGEMLAWLADEGAVRFEEVTVWDRKRDPNQWQEVRNYLFPDVDDSELTDSDLQEIEDEIRKENEKDDEIRTRFPQYVLPGGENYREVVMAMPIVAPPADITQWSAVKKKGTRLPWAGAPEPIDVWEIRDTEGKYVRSLPVSQFPTAEAALARSAEMYDTRDEQGRRTTEYTSTHFPDVPNYVAHMRVNERTDANGEPGLFIEEIQSDRHQAGREKGYFGDRESEIDRQKADLLEQEREQSRIMAELEPMLTWNHNGKEVRADGYYAVKIKEGSRWESFSWEGRGAAEFYAGLTEERGKAYMAFLDAKYLRNELARKAGNIRNTGIADAPFRTTWHLAMFKRALRDAVASGKKWIGWTTAATQAARYSKALQDAVSNITWKDNKASVATKSQGIINLTFADGDGKITTSSNPQLVGEYLRNVVGKTVTEKMLGNPSGRVEGDTLTIGSDLYRMLYDSDGTSGGLVKDAGKYVKPWGGRVEKSGIYDPTVSGEMNGWDTQGLGERAYTYMKASGGDIDAAIQRANESPQSPIRDAAISQLKEAKSRGRAEPSTPIWRIDITPEMAASVSTQGQPLFQLGTTPAQPATPDNPAYRRAAYMSVYEGNLAYRFREGDRPEVERVLDPDKRTWRQKLMDMVSKTDSLIRPHSVLRKDWKRLYTAVTVHMSSLLTRAGKLDLSGETGEQLNKAMGTTAPLFTADQAKEINDAVERMRADYESRSDERKDRLRKDRDNAKRRLETAFAKGTGRENLKAYTRALKNLERKHAEKMALIEPDREIFEARLLEKKALMRAQAIEKSAAQHRLVRDAALSWLEKNAPEVHKWASETRALIDEIQGYIVKLEGLDPRLALTIDASKGVYLTRRYAIHSDPELARKMRESDAEPFLNARENLIKLFEDNFVEHEVEALKGRKRPPDGAPDRNAPMDEWAAFAREQIAKRDLAHLDEAGELEGMSPEAARIHADAKLRERAVHAFHDFIVGHETAQGVGSGTGAGTDGLRVPIERFMSKKDLPQEIRDALMEITDPVFNSLSTFMGLAKILVDHRTSVNAAKSGLEAGIFVPEAVAKANRAKYGHWVEVETSPAFPGLKGLYTTPEYKKQFNLYFRGGRGAMGTEADEIMNGITKTMMRFTGTSLGVMTIGSVGYYPRNMIGAYFMAMASGVHLEDIGKGFGEAWQSYMSDLGSANPEKANSVLELVALGILKDASHIEYVKELTRLGVDDPVKMLNSIPTTAAEMIAANPAVRTAKDVASGIYTKLRATAEFTETVATPAVYFKQLRETEEAMRHDFGDNFDRAEAKRVAAARTLQTMPARTETPQIVEAFSKNPISAMIAPYFRFTADIHRCVIGHIMQIAEDFKSANPVRRRYAATHLSAFSIMLTTSMAFSLIAKAVAGIGDDEEEALRAALPSYAKNSQFIPFIKGDEVVLWDLSFLIPFSKVVDPVTATISNPTEIADIWVRHVASDILGENITSGAVMDWARNRDETTGLPIYFDSDTIGEKATKGLMHVVKSAYTPPVLDKLGKAFSATQQSVGTDSFWYTPLGIVAGHASPIRPRTFRLEDMAFRANSNAVKENRNEWLRTRELKSRAALGTFTGLEDAIQGLYDDRVRARTRVWEKEYRVAQGFMSLGMSKEAFRSSMVRAGFSREASGRLLNTGTVSKPTFGREEMEIISKADPARAEILRKVVDRQPDRIDVSGK